MWDEIGWKYQPSVEVAFSSMMEAAKREAREGFVVVQLPLGMGISELQLYFPNADTIWWFNLLPDHYRVYTAGVYTTFQIFPWMELYKGT